MIQISKYIHISSHQNKILIYVFYMYMFPDKISIVTLLTDLLLNTVNKIIKAFKF